MDRFQRFNNYARVALASVASAVAVLILDATSAFLKNRLLGGVAAVLFVSILALVGSNILETAVEKSIRMRRWIAEDDFIEGWWIDLADEPTGGSHRHASIQQITYREGTFDVSGSSFLRSGERLATWSSVACHYSRRTLFVVYEAQTSLVGGGFERGLVQMQFDRPPTSYSGYLHDFSGQVIRSLRGEKVSNDDFVRHNGLQTVADRLMLLQSRVPGWGSIS